MSTTAPHLIDALTTSDDSPENIAAMERAIVFLDKVDSRFSNIASGLIHDAHDTVHSVLKGMLIDKQWITSAVTKAHVLRHNLDIDYNAAMFLLDYVIRTKSATSLQVSDDERTNFSLRLTVHSGDMIILAKYPFLRPVLTEVSEEDVNRYCQPLAVASHVLGARYDIHPFLEEAPSFIMWASEQENMHELLSVALRIENLNPKTVQALSFSSRTLQEAPHASL